MNRRDRARWRNAQTIPELGELVIAWLNFEIRQTPGHAGLPDPETIPLIGPLTAANRAGFVTNNSQLAERHGAEAWEAWVEGFATEATYWDLRDRVAAVPPLQMTGCRGVIHQCGKTRPWEQCPGEEARIWWRMACPAVADQLAGMRWVMIGDPEPGCNDRLWPLLEKFAVTPGGEPAAEQRCPERYTDASGFLVCHESPGHAGDHRDLVAHLLWTVDGLGGLHVFPASDAR